MRKFPLKNYKWPTDIWKNVILTRNQRNTIRNSNMIPFFFFVNQIGKDKNKKVTIPTVGMDAQKEALSCITHECIYCLNFPKGISQ